MPKLIDGSTPKQQVSTRLSKEAIAALKAIKTAKGGSVSGIAEAILESAKNVKPEHYFAALAAFERVGRDGN